MSLIRHLKRLVYGLSEYALSPGSSEEHHHYTPDYDDVRAARTILQSLKLPTELVLDILDRARYWPCAHFVTRNRKSVKSGMNIVSEICFEGPVFPPSVLESFQGEKVKLKEISWYIMSKDQGWTSEGTEGTFQTHSWTDVSILRPLGDSRDPCLSAVELARTFGEVTELMDILSPRGWTMVPHQTDDGLSHTWRLQGNRVAGQNPESYHITWSQDENRVIADDGAGNGKGFIDLIQEGDRVVVWARCQYPGWCCEVHELEMALFYGF
ncbi:hypothetical protein BU24DRAFT_421275 [Aaosphaeria arxii CBS 175.79]|uniref:Uncharacterized protein n=1 Tax=Aaosphaeria arxii CBS 175.79 TaxID=1450172 RepID=A0A6A5Y161_9PLEO|nr:uncharacterized protein BU24DRAFT_421275 [Aaosphaeria arxii CBS 175.79]KAF2018294.1 hypothetical protein BU24DRAFT_421275 [Aaosphaeria arxii CBS 175.79]